MEVVFNNFMGGLNNKLRPSKIGKTQSTVLDNIDVSSGTLKPTLKDIRLGQRVPYQLVHFNKLLGTTQKLTDMDNMISQWGKYFTKDKVYFVNDANTISNSAYGIGAPIAAEFTTNVNKIGFNNISGLKGITYGLTEDATGNLISDLVIDGLSKEAITIYKAWESEALIVYALDTNGTELTGKIKDVLHDKMPYMIGSIKYAYEYSDQNVGYTAAAATNIFNLHYEAFMYSVLHSLDGVKQEVSFIDVVGNPIDIHKAILTNAMIVINADSSGITTGYARGNIVENIPFMLGTEKYTFSSTTTTGYTSINPTDGDTLGWKSFVKYDPTDYDASDYHTYAVTLYNSKTGQETPPVYGTTTKIHPAELGTNFTLMLTPDVDGVYTDFTKARIYRVSGPYKEYRFVKEVTPTTSGNSKVIVLDTLVKNSELTYICETTGHVGKPTMQGIVLHANRVFGYNGNTVYFTLTDSPYSWSEFATIYVEGGILSVQTTSSGLLVITNAYKAYVITGTNPNTFVLRKIGDNVGYTEGMVGVKGNAYWIYNNDIYTSNGSSIANLTEGKFELPNESIVDINVLNEDIYLVYTNEIYKIHKNAILRLDIPSITDTVITDGELHYFQNGYEYKLEGSTIANEWKYKSPDIYVTTISEVKEFDEIEIVSEGKVNVQIHLDSVMVLETLLTSDSLIVTNLKLPVSDNKGHILTVTLKGTGEVYEYKIVTVGADDGR